MACPPYAKKRRFAEASSQLVSKAVEDANPNLTKVAKSFWVAVFKSFAKRRALISTWKLAQRLN